MKLRRVGGGARVAAGLGALALVVGCSSDSNGTGGKKNDHTNADSGTDGGGAKGPDQWGNQGYDVQSTWHNTTETKITTANVASLKEMWSMPLGSESTATAVGNRVYVSSSSGISALDADTGTVIWTQ